MDEPQKTCIFFYIRRNGYEKKVTTSKKRASETGSPARGFLSAAILWLFALPLHGQDVYRYLNDEGEALQCRIDLINQAQKEILLSTYIIEGDLIGLATLNLLENAVKRGVRVKLLLDGKGNKLPVSLLHYLDQKGIEVRLFNFTSLPRLRSLFHRMHSKMLITDGWNLIIGGRNLQEEYYSLHEVNFLDREVYIRSNSAISAARRHFNEIWDHPTLTSKKRRVQVNRRGRWAWDKEIAQALKRVQERLDLRLPSKSDWAEGVAPTRNFVVFTHDRFLMKKAINRPSKRKDKTCTRTLITLVDSAKASVDIENAYFLPTRRFFRALKRARHRGIKIRVLTNSAYTSDLPLVQSVYSYKRRKYRRIGLELWEYYGVKMLHTKAMTIDGRIVINGSYNLDKSSEKYSTEVFSYVDDPWLAEEQLGYMKATYKYSLCISNSQLSAGWAAYLPPPSELQKKRQRLVKLYCWTLAPIVDLFL